MIRTHYDNLQISQSASDAVIRAAYRALSQKHHPDKNPSNREAAEKAMKMINGAYSVLSDPTLRKEHDSWIALQLQDALNTQLRSHNLESTPHSSEVVEEKATQSPTQHAVVQSRPSRIAGTGAIAIAIGLTSTSLLGQLVSNKAENQTILLFLGTMAFLALAIGIPVLLYAGFAALRKKTIEEGLASWAKPLWETALGAAVVTTVVSIILAWLNRP